MSVTKHWLLDGCYLRESCQWRNTDYQPDATIGNHFSDKIPTTSRMLPSGIMSVTQYWLPVGCYPRQPCQWRNTDYWPDATIENHVSEDTLITSRMLPSGNKSPSVGVLTRCSDDNKNVGILFNAISMVHVYNRHNITVFMCSWHFQRFTCFVLFFSFTGTVHSTQYISVEFYILLVF